MSALLTLPHDRIAGEQRQIEAQAAGYAEWRRSQWRFGALCAAVYADGLAIAFASFGLVGDWAPIALWSGLLIGNLAVFTFVVTLWQREII